MKNENTISYDSLSSHCKGNIEAINQILHHYRGYITKRSLRLMKDEYGNQSMVVDEVLRGRMETRLITKILSFEIK